MAINPFDDPFRSGGASDAADKIFSPFRFLGKGRRGSAKPAGGKDGKDGKDGSEPLEIDSGDPPAKKDKQDKPRVILKNPKWEAEEVGFNEETDISVEAEIPEVHAHKTKVAFELFAKTPNGPEKISKAEGQAKDGKALARIPVYMPSYRDAEGNLLSKAEYYFTAKHSESDLFKDENATRTIDHMADRLIDSHVLEDVTFATGKSFPKPDQAGSLKALGAAVEAWRDKHPEAKVAVFGHADAVGEEQDNKTLSERRGRALQAFLAKDPSAWESLYGKEKWGLASTQELLKHLGHDPGPIDGKDGPKTREAVKGFQGKRGLKTDGVAGPKTRESLYLAFMEDCESPGCKSKEFDRIDGHPYAGCSEFNLAKKTDGACEDNRRVAVLLLKSNKSFPIQYPCRKGDIGPCRKQAERKGERKSPGFKCLFYDQLVKEEKKGGGGGGAPKPGAVRAFLHSSEKEIKRFVNIDEAGQGMVFDLEVQVEGDVKKVYWKAVAGKDNSKRNDPAPGWIDPKTGKSAALKDGVGEFESDVVDGKAKAGFCLGLAGGDEFTFEAGASKGRKELEQKVVNWRRLWYQLTHHKDIAPPGMDTAVKKLKDVFIEWVAEPAAKHELAPKGEVIVGNHNAADYHKLLAARHPGQCAHIILCDYQYDGLRHDGSHFTTMSSQPFTGPKGDITVSDDANNLKVLNPPLPKGAKLLLAGAWNNASTGKSGKLTDDPSKCDDNTGLAKWKDQDTFEVELPKNATPSDKTPVMVSLRTTAASGPWGGDGGTAPHNLVVIDSSDVIHTQVVLHELGHIMNMVPYAGSYKAPPGFELADHTLSYMGMGGAGSHCSWEIDKAKSTPTHNVDGKCIMFHQLNYNCKLVYCPDCAPFVKAQSLQAFHDLKG